jgi:hypothetical protein
MSGPFERPVVTFHRRGRDQLVIAHEGRQVGDLRRFADGWRARIGGEVVGEGADLVALKAALTTAIIDAMNRLMRPR